MEHLTSVLFFLLLLSGSLFLFVTCTSTSVYVQDLSCTVSNTIHTSPLIYGCRKMPGMCQQRLGKTRLPANRRACKRMLVFKLYLWRGGLGFVCLLAVLYMKQALLYALLANWPLMWLCFYYLEHSFPKCRLCVEVLFMSAYAKLQRNNMILK